MSTQSSSDAKSSRSRGWTKYVDDVYDPIKVGSIDGTDTEPHDRAIIRALKSTYKPNERVVGEPRHTVFVGRLHDKTDEDKLKHKFRKCGKVRRCRVVRDIITGASKCYGFIEFESRSEAREAVSTMNKAIIHDCEIIVDYECERTLKGWKPRRLGGGFGGKKESGQLRFGGRVRPFQRPFEVGDSSKPTNFREVFRQQKLHQHR
ncbi:U11/U12 small nuclear ribonucleoprotein 35 kDa protein-like [Bradysia coprophila]|uniref:U11/U12 small nuclear ribonucleoprotein 35 kDa protein-like n=1 Tax=Bradysia coprophila TaxID=38358 RepID=UPI00187D7602|nr:U11/U12 small nuclear ribonucleoprotein 35 kDa protein-like [Bradysia coprophila]